MDALIHSAFVRWRAECLWVLCCCPHRESRTTSRNPLIWKGSVECQGEMVGRLEGLPVCRYVHSLMILWWPSCLYNNINNNGLHLYSAFLPYRHSKHLMNRVHYSFRHSHTGGVSIFTHLWYYSISSYLVFRAWYAVILSHVVLLRVNTGFPAYRASLDLKDWAGFRWVFI